MSQVTKKLFIFVLFNLIIKFSFGLYVIPTIINDFPISYIYNGTMSYYTNWTLFRSQKEKRTDIQITFSCNDLTRDSKKCDLISSLPLNRVWGHFFSEACAVSYDGSVSDCTLNICDDFIPKPTNVKFSRRVPTSGGNVTITGKNLRLCTTVPQYIILYLYQSAPTNCNILGNIEDPNFDCENFVVNFTSGSGNARVQFQTGPNGLVNFTYASPTLELSKLEIDTVKSSITLNGDNFYVANSKIKLNLDGIQQQDLNITIPHKQIVVKNFKRIYGGPMNIDLAVDNIQLDTPQYYCFIPVPTSINSISSNLGGVLTINGDFFPLFGSSASLVNIKIGSEICNNINIKSNTTVECQLSKRTINEGSNQLVNISIGNNDAPIQCSNNNQFNFKYNVPNVINAIHKAGTRSVTINGNILGTNDSTKVIVNGVNEIIPSIVSGVNDETKLEFELPPLKCGNNIKLKVINEGNPSNEITFNAEIFVVPYHSPFVNNGSDLSLYVQYINCDDLSNPINSTFNSKTTTCTTPLLVKDYSTNDEYYSTTCSVSPGTGSQHDITIGYGNQSFKTQFSYGAPIIYDYHINGHNVTVNGINFNNDQSLFNASFFNRTIKPIDGTLKDNQFIFTLEDNDENSNLDIIVDGIKNENVTFIQLLPRNISIDDSQIISTLNGKLEIIGKNLLSSNSNNPDYLIHVFAKPENGDNYECKTVVIDDHHLIANMPNGTGTPINVTVITGQNNNIETFKVIQYHQHLVSSSNSIFNSSSKMMAVHFIGSNFSSNAQISLNDYQNYNNLPCNLDFIADSETPFDESNTLACQFEFTEKEPTYLYVKLQMGKEESNHNTTVTINNDPSNNNDGKGSSGLSGGQIAGIVVGCCVFAGGITAAAVIYRHSIKKKLSGKSAPK